MAVLFTVKYTFALNDIFLPFYVHPSIRIFFSIHLVIFVAPVFQLNTLKDDFGAFVMITLR